MAARAGAIDDAFRTAVADAQAAYDSAVAKSAAAVTQQKTAATAVEKAQDDLNSFRSRSNAQFFDEGIDRAKMAVLTTAQSNKAAADTELVNARSAETTAKSNLAAAKNALTTSGHV